jgi:hypothetical protein
MNSKAKIWCKFWLQYEKDVECEASICAWSCWKGQLINAEVGMSKVNCAQIGCSKSFVTKAGWVTGEGEEASRGCVEYEARLAISEVEERRQGADIFQGISLPSP